MKNLLFLLIIALLTVGCSSTAATPTEEPTTEAMTEMADDSPAETEEAVTEAATSEATEEATEEAAMADESTGEIDHRAMLSELLFETRGYDSAVRLLNEIEATGDTRFVAGLIDTMRYQRQLEGEISTVLSRLTGAEDVDQNWGAWVEWAGRHPEIESFEEYDAWKIAIFRRIDPAFERFIYDDVAIAPGSRLEEVVWGGVQVDGIPALDNPVMIDPEQAAYLVPNERVFGVSINGDTRAYPARFLDWHEMFNDVVGGEPVSLAYCTLRGAAVLYKTTIDESQLPEGYSLTGGQGSYPDTEHLTFGSSGFLYQSNKLMYDRNTDTLWHQILGTPAFGRLVGSGLELERLPVTLTTWEEWYEAHPDTKVMAFETGFDRDYGAGVAYAEYFASEETMFPVWQRSQVLPTKSWVFTQLIDGQPKAYPLGVLEEAQIVNDTLAGQEMVVIYDEGGHGARAYESGGLTFTEVDQAAQTATDADGNTWQITEDALLSETGDSLERLPGHMAYWFGWFSFFPNTEIYGVEG